MVYHETTMDENFLFQKPSGPLDKYSRKPHFFPEYNVKVGNDVSWK